MPRNVFESLRHPWWTLAISAVVITVLLIKKTLLAPGAC